MKKIIIVGFFSAFYIPLLFSQSWVHDGGDFTKSVGYNRVAEGYDKYIRGVLSIYLFNDFNAPVEFTYYPPFPGRYGFRLVRDSLILAYYIEIKRVTNFENVHQWNKSFGFPVFLLPAIPEDVREQLIEHNKAAYTEYIESAKRIKVQTQSFPISDQFAEKLYKNMVSFIDNFKARRDYPMIVNGEKIVFVITGGESVTFSTVVNNELRTLNIHAPRGNARIMSDICLKIIADADVGQLDETKYLSMLCSLEN